MGVAAPATRGRAAYRSGDLTATGSLAVAAPDAMLHCIHNFRRGMHARDGPAGTIGAPQHSLASAK
jgi:hypothetical protein